VPIPSPRSLLRQRERGAAIADFALVSGLVTLMFVAVFQVGLALHVRNTLISCASEGARYGSRADAAPADGVARARLLIGESLSSRFAGNVTATRTQSGGVQVIEMTVVAPLPLLGTLGPQESLTVTAHAFAENQ